MIDIPLNDDKFIEGLQRATKAVRLFGLACEKLERELSSVRKEEVDTVVAAETDTWIE